MAQAVGKALAKFLVPRPHCLKGDDNTTLRQEQFDVPQAEAEGMAQPNSMTDDLGGKAMPIARVGRELHAASLAGRKPDCQIRLT